MSIGLDYLKNVGLHKQVCSFATHDIPAAVNAASKINYHELQQHAFKELVTFAANPLNSEEETTLILDCLGKIEDEKSRNKLSERMVRKSSAKTDKIGQENIDAGKKQRDKRNEVDLNTLSLLNEKITALQFTEAFDVARELQMPDNRLKGFCTLASKLPKDYVMPARDVEEIEQKKTSLIEQLESIEQLEPKIIAKFLKDCQKLIMKTVIAGQPEIALEIAQKISAKNIESADVENGLERATSITAIYNQTAAESLLKLVTIPKRQKDGSRDLEEISKAKNSIG